MALIKLLGTCAIASIGTASVICHITITYLFFNPEVGLELVKYFQG